jgi:hypothetical protein
VENGIVTLAQIFDVQKESAKFLGTINREIGFGSQRRVLYLNRNS